LYNSLPVFGPLPFSVKKEYRFVYSKIYYCKSHKYPRILRLFMIIPVRVLWYYKAVTMIVLEIKANARRVTSAHQISLLKQIRGICYLAFMKNSPPDLYYYLRIYEHKINIGENYLADEHFSPILAYLISGKNWEVLKDKFRFWQIFKPVIPETVDIIAVFRNEESLFIGENGILPEGEMFVKPLDSYGGNGCKKINFNKNGYSESGANGVLYDRENLIKLLKSRSKQDTYLLQAFQYNHPSLVGLSNGNLCTCRINTFLDSNGHIGILFAIFMMPVGESVTSNGNGIHALVDLETGRLSAAINLSHPFEHIDFHPQGGGQIAQTILPFWDDAKALCRKAHRLVPDLPIVGWDIAFTPQGVVLIEGNLIWPVGFWSLLHLNEEVCLNFIEIIEEYLKQTIRN